jgi:lipoyl(octanoyl) transferase
MALAKSVNPDLGAARLPLQVYLLGTVDFEALLRCQRRLHYDISSERTHAALILCEHPSLISVGRHGSRAHILMEPRELQLRGLRLRWVNRGGGCWLHQAGQLAAYAILPLDRLNLTISLYQRRLGEIVQTWLEDHNVHSQWHNGGAWVGSRLLAGIGCAVRDWVSYFGLCLNINPVLDPYRLVKATSRATLPMTSLERERHGRMRPSMARERFIERFQEGFGFSRLSLFTEHPLLKESSKKSAPPRILV